MSKKVGEVFVDSGQIMIGDPCYIDDTWNGDFADDRPGEFSYAGACTATLSENGYGVLQKGMGFACATRWGDGRYPIFAELDHSNRVVSLTIYFDEYPDDDDEDAVFEECERCGTKVDLAFMSFDGRCEDCQEIENEQS